MAAPSREDHRGAEAAATKLKTVVWSQRIPEKDKDIIDQVLDQYQIEKGLDSKGEALAHFIKNRVEVAESERSDGVLIPEIHYPDDLEFEQTCPFGYLKKIATPRHKGELWYCLKQQGPSKKGKPELLADGKDKTSIRKICAACQLTWQADPGKMDQVKMVFQQLGDETLRSTLYFCTRDALGSDPGIKLSPSIKGRFYCIERDKKVTIKNTCIASGCPFLVQRDISLAVGETTPFMEAQKKLEVIQ